MNEERTMDVVENVEAVAEMAKESNSIGGKTVVVLVLAGAGAFCLGRSICKGVKKGYNYIKSKADEKKEVKKADMFIDGLENDEEDFVDEV